MRRIRPTTLRLVAALAVGIGATAHMSSWGQTPATNTQTRTFDIPSGALRDTLSVIQAVTGQRVSYSDTLVQGRESRAVKGQLSLKEALEMALEGTGISVSLNADGSVTLAASTGLALQSVEIRGSRVSHLAATNRTGTRTDVDPMELPQSVTTVDKGLLSQQQIRDVREAMSGVSGTGTATSGEASGGTIVTVRGFAASLMRNGFVVPSGTYFNPPLIALERIEVVKGPEAVVAGTTAYGGVVNVITKAPTDRPVTEGLVSFGDHGYFELGADLARPLSEDKTLLGRIIVSKSGEGRSDQDYAGDRREYVSPALTWANRSTGTDVTLSYEWQKNHVKPGRQIPFSPDEPYFTGRLVHMGPRDVGIDSKEEVVSLSVDQRIATGWTAGVKLARDDRHDVGIANPSFVYSWLGYDYPTVLSQVSEQDNKSLSKTRYYAARWFEGDAMYHLERKRLADNPDQRIAEDPALFTTAAIELVMSLVGVATQVAVYGTVLWHVELPPSSSLHNVPGSAVMAALAMGAGFSLAVHAIGRRLPKILAETQHVEADFRFALMQQREGAEQIAFLRGHSFEQSRLAELFGAVARNWRVSLAKGLQVEGAANLYAIGSTFIATLVLMPSVLSGTMSMGGLMQAQLAFTQVALAMSWLGDNFYAISDWLAATRRLTVLNRVLSRSPGRSIGFGQHDHPTIEITSLVVNRPDGLRLLALDRLSIHRGQRWLLQGKSGVGKSTLLRSLAGLWPEAEGTVVMPSGASIMFVPQRPYVAPGTLKEALCYPNPTHEVPDERCTSALVACGLAERVIDLHQHRRWSRVLSLGEQQQLMFARVGIAAPDFLFMDEATSAVDEATEGHCFEWLLRTPLQRVHRPCRSTPVGRAVAEGAARG